ncbi:hypothetical protein VUR80DRAFT_736 [Thermomyces stellatus]
MGIILRSFLISRGGSKGIPANYCHSQLGPGRPWGQPRLYSSPPLLFSFRRLWRPFYYSHHLHLIETLALAVAQVTMAVPFRSFFLLLTVLAVKVLGQCVSYGIDYANGGEYNIDSTLNEYFSFTTIFQGTPRFSWTGTAVWNSKRSGHVSAGGPGIFGGKCRHGFA